MKWIISNGGPLIFSSKKSAEHWKGTAGSSLKKKETDYERACAIYDYIDVIVSGKDDVAVLGDEPMQSKIFKDKERIFIARWEYCKSEDLADDVLKNLPKDLNIISNDKFMRLLGGELIIFDSTLSLKSTPLHR